jgi:hypothetical protein
MSLPLPLLLPSSFPFSNPHSTRHQIQTLRLVECRRAASPFQAYPQENHAQHEAAVMGPGFRKGKPVTCRRFAVVWFRSVRRQEVNHLLGRYLLAVKQLDWTRHGVAARSFCRGRADVSFACHIAHCSAQFFERFVCRQNDSEHPRELRFLSAHRVFEAYPPFVSQMALCVCLFRYDIQPSGVLFHVDLICY